MSDRFEQLDRGERTGRLSIIVVLFIGIVKGFVGLSTGSISLIAQAVDSVKDIISLIAVVAGFRISKKEPSERFTYGYYKIENIISLILSTLILVTGGQILRESILQIINPTQISMPIIAASVAIVSIPIIYWLQRYTEGVAEDINSQSLRNQASDFMVDIYSSIIVLIGVFASIFGYPSVEGVAGSIISLLVIKMGLSLTWDSLLGLMDAVENPDRIIKIKEIAESIKGVREAYNIRLRSTGTFCMGEISIGVDKELHVDQAHRLSEIVENKIKEELPAVELISVHIEPVEEATRLVTIPIVEDHGIYSKVSSHLGEAPYFLFVKIVDSEIERWVVKPNESKNLERKKGINIAKMLIDENATDLIATSVSSVIFHVLRDNFIQIYKIPDENKAKELIDLLLDEKLERIDELDVN